MHILEQRNKDRSLKEFCCLIDENIDDMLEKTNIKELNLSPIAKNMLSNYDINTLSEILILSPQEILDMNNSEFYIVYEIFDKCINKVTQIISKANYYPQEIINFDVIEPLRINVFCDNKVSEKTLALLPLFSDNNNFPISIDLHSSYKGEESIDLLNLSYGTYNILTNLNIDVISQLFLTRTSVIIGDRVDGHNTINEIINNIRYLYFADVMITDLYKFIDICEQYNTKHKAIFLDYLCNSDGNYISYEDIARKYRLNESAGREISFKIVKKAKRFIEINDKLPIFNIVNDALRRRRGPISIKSLYSETYLTNKSEIELKRLVRFHNLLYGTTYIDFKNCVFGYRDDKDKTKYYEPALGSKSESVSFNKCKSIVATTSYKISDNNKKNVSDIDESEEFLKIDDVSSYIHKNKTMKEIFNLSYEYVNDVLSKISIKELILSVRATNVLSYYNILTIKDLVFLSPQEILDMKNAGELTVNEIFRQCRELIIKIIQDASFYLQKMKESIAVEQISKDDFKYYKVTKDRLLLLPLFADNNDFAQVVELHGSYRGESSIKLLFLSVRAKNILNGLNISTLKGLLLTKSSRIFAEQNCGKKTLNDITEKVMSFYFADVVVKNIYDLIDLCEPDSIKKQNILLDYLCNSDGKYKTYNEVAPKYDVSRQRIQQITSSLVGKIKKYLKKNNNLFVFNTINNALKTYKGPISITGLSKENNENEKKGIQLKKTVRLYYLLYESIKIDTKNFLFWNENDKCIDCCVLINNSGTGQKNNISHIADECERRNCDIGPEKDFDIAGLNNFESKAYDTISKSVNDEKDIVNYLKVNINYLELFRLKGISTNKYKDIILEHLTENDGNTSTLNLNRLSRMIGFDYNVVIDSLNSDIYEIFKEVCSFPFLIYDGNDSWEVDIYFKNKNNWELVEASNQLSDTEDIEYVASSLKEEPYDDSKVIVNKIIRSLKNRVTSYKQYWLKALIYCAENNLLEVTFLDMGKLMVAFAWEDVLVIKKEFNARDQIPVIINSLYFKVGLSKSSSFKDIFRTLKENNHLVEKDVLKIVKYVQYHFLKVFIECEYVPKNPNDFKIMVSKNSNQEESIYILKTDRIIIKNNFIKSLSEIKKCINSSG